MYFLSVQLLLPASHNLFNKITSNLILNFDINLNNNNNSICLGHLRDFLESVLINMGTGGKIRCGRGSWWLGREVVVVV